MIAPDNKTTYLLNNRFGDDLDDRKTVSHS